MQTINISFLLPILDMQVDCISAVLWLSRARRQFWLMEGGGMLYIHYLQIWPLDLL